MFVIWIIVKIKVVVARKVMIVTMEGMPASKEKVYDKLYILQ